MIKIKIKCHLKRNNLLNYEQENHLILKLNIRNKEKHRSHLQLTQLQYNHYNNNLIYHQVINQENQMMLKANK
jgi:hypothetical protein